MRVTVFGSAMPRPGEIDYLAAMALGQILAKDGHSVLTGDIPGRWKPSRVGQPKPAGT